MITIELAASGSGTTSRKATGNADASTFTRDASVKLLNVAVPFESVTPLRTSPLEPVTVTAAPATTAPLASLTVTVKFLDACALAPAARAKKQVRRAIKRKLFIEKLLR